MTPPPLTVHPSTLPSHTITLRSISATRIPTAAAEEDEGDEVALCALPPPSDGPPPPPPAAAARGDVTSRGAAAEAAAEAPLPSPIPSDWPGGPDPAAAPAAAWAWSRSRDDAPPAACAGARSEPGERVSGGVEALLGRGAYRSVSNARGGGMEQGAVVVGTLKATTQAGSVPAAAAWVWGGSTHSSQISSTSQPPPCFDALIFLSPPPSLAHFALH